MKKRKNKAKPSDLGSGAAARAGRTLKGRMAQLKEQERKAMGKKKKTKKTKK